MNFTGTESGTPVDRPIGAVFFDYTRTQIETLLARRGALGIRLHFNRARPENPTALYTAACDDTFDIMDADLDARDDYFKSDGGAVRSSLVPDIIQSTVMPKANACVYFSRQLLEGQFLDNQAITKLRFFVVGLDVPNVSGQPCMSLVVTGLTAGNQLTGPILQSTSPCPPSCPDGYP